ncbi:hypothetical protein GCM10009773_20230 [Williamsia serinedens]
MSPWTEWKPPACPACGADWRRPRSHLVGWSNQREVPCRHWVCRTCDAVTAADDISTAPRSLRRQSGGGPTR